MEIIEKIRKEIERQLERATTEQEKYPDMPKYRWYLREGKKELCSDLLDYMYDALHIKEPTTDSLQEETPTDLEEAADKYASDSTGFIDMTAYRAFIAGAEWQKEQMMKEAVEGKVFMSFAPGHNQMVMADVDLPTNTKVRIIVLKAEEE